MDEVRSASSDISCSNGVGLNFFFFCSRLMVALSTDYARAVPTGTIPYKDYWLIAEYYCNAPWNTYDVPSVPHGGCVK